MSVAGQPSLSSALLAGLRPQRNYRSAFRHARNPPAGIQVGWGCNARQRWIPSSTVCDAGADSQIVCRYGTRVGKRLSFPHSSTWQQPFEKNRFLVIICFDVKLLYFIKRKCFPLYHYVMIRISRLLNQAKQA
jgi:hypothetical protein